MVCANRRFYLQWGLGSLVARILVGIYFVKAFYEKEIYSLRLYGEPPGIGAKRLAVTFSRSEEPWPKCAGTGGGSCPQGSDHSNLSIVSGSLVVCIRMDMDGWGADDWTDVIHFLFMGAGLLSLLDNFPCRWWMG